MGKMKSNENATTLAKNIRALRIYYGENQTELAKILNCEQQTISQYETDSVNNKERHIPTHDNLIRLANHFEVTITELESEDFGYLGKASKDVILDYYHHIDSIFPIVFTDCALSNKSFNKAYQKHISIYKTISSILLIDDSIDDNFDKLIDDFEEMNSDYHEALKEKSIESEAAINIIACLYLELFFFKIVRVIFNRTDYRAHIIKRTQKLSPDFRIDLDENEYFSAEENKELDSHICDLIKEICDLRIISKAKYPELIEFYLALQFIMNFADNNLSMFFNRRIGKEMMASFESVGNKYATKFREL